LFVALLMNDLNEEDFWRELFVVKMRREERSVAALQANPDLKTSMERPMIWAASESSPASMSLCRANNLDTAGGSQLLEHSFHLRFSVNVLSIRPSNNGNNCDTERNP
jgi:hypothetical protein